MRYARKRHALTVVMVSKVLSFFEVQFGITCTYLSIQIIKVVLCEFCDETCCEKCVKHVCCDHPGCSCITCSECADHESGHPGHVHLVISCNVCNRNQCLGHLLGEFVKRGEDEFCSNCNERAAWMLSYYNQHFEEWLNIMENKYNGKTHKSVVLGTTSTFSERMKEREVLCQRCNAIGDKLPLKQKQLEHYDYWVKNFEEPLLGSHSHEYGHPSHTKTLNIHTLRR